MSKTFIINFKDGSSEKRDYKEVDYIEVYHNYLIVHLKRGMNYIYELNTIKSYGKV